MSYLIRGTYPLAAPQVAFDLYFLLDIWICFNTAVWLPSGILEVSPKKIRRRYLHRWFILDFLSSAPFPYLYLFKRLAEGDTRGERNGYQRLLRLAKLLRLSRIQRLIKKYEDQSSIDITP